VRLEDHGITVRDVSYSARIGIRVGTDKLWRATAEVVPPG
jgi:3-methyladenine DNA glycosylase Mpg